MKKKTGNVQLGVENEHKWLVFCWSWKEIKENGRTDAFCFLLSSFRTSFFFFSKWVKHFPVNLKTEKKVLIQEKKSVLLGLSCEWEHRRQVVWFSTTKKRVFCETWLGLIIKVTCQFQSVSGALEKWTDRTSLTKKINVVKKYSIKTKHVFFEWEKKQQQSAVSILAFMLVVVLKKKRYISVLSLKFKPLKKKVSIWLNGFFFMDASIRSKKRKKRRKF